VALPYAPDWTFSFNPDYRVMVGNDYELIVGANVRFSDGYWLSDNEDPRNEVGSFERVDLRIGLAPRDGCWEAALYGRDLTDERLTVDCVTGMVPGASPHPRAAPNPADSGSGAAALRSRTRIASSA
jgi:hypothetical protein